MRRAAGGGAVRRGPGLPIWHPRDGGRFIGTASLNILRDPDSDWVNVGTYRNQIFERDAMGMYISPGKHGLLMRQRYLDRGRRCPVVVVVGADPLLFMAACAEGIAYGQGELDWAGGVRGAPVEVVRGRHTGLPIPATAEIGPCCW
jgi:4-hydroxy-3-polyprenylbenzoate decarboxylase